MAAVGGAEIGGSTMTINVLGTDYTIEVRKTAEDPKLENVNGYCEPYSKKIIVEDVQPEVDTVDRLDLFKCRVLRHEIVHAFLFESGLAQNSDWARNEELVDWIAFQLPKIVAVMQKVGTLGEASPLCSDGIYSIYLDKKKLGRSVGNATGVECAKEASQRCTDAERNKVC